MYTIPTPANDGPALVCGYYYAVILYVNTNCSQSIALTHFRLNCSPTIDLRNSTRVMCPGETAGLAANVTGGSVSTAYTLDWTPVSPSGPSVYNGPLTSVIVSPAVTTDYLCTVTDNATGCTSTALWTVYVVNLDPSFSVNFNTTQPTYFTAEITPNDPNSNYYIGFPGFSYGYVIEEIDGSLNSYYAEPGTDCWQNYSSPPESLSGYVSTGTGTWLAPPSSPYCSLTPGQFLYNHTYRITRGVWSDLRGSYCSYRQFSVLFLMTKSGNIVSAEETTAPDFSGHFLSTQADEKDDDITVFPNPTNGLVQVRSTSGTPLDFELYSPSGQKISVEYNSDGYLDLSKLSKGIYVLQVVSENRTSTQKIILK